jgi:hypothetical protein
MDYYINERAKDSKKFTLDVKGELAFISSKKFDDFNVIYKLPNFGVVSYNGVGTVETANFLKKSLEFARKNIIIK